MKPKRNSNQPPSLGVLLGRNIARARHDKGWTQQELAERVGIESVTMSRIETGSSLPSLSRLADIAGTLDVAIASLVSGTSHHVSDQSYEIAACLSKLHPNDRHMLMDMVRQLSARLAHK